MANPISETQSINPGSLIELFELTTDAALHGSATTYRFHAGTNEINNGNIIWDGNTYIAIPLEADGFKYANGQLPRPTLTISNVTNVITAILLNVNQVTPGNDLTGAVVKRRTTLARFLDAANFAPVATTTTTTTTIADPSDIESVTYTVTVVQDSNGANVFAINGVQKPVITMKRGSIYIFNQSHSSNVGHPLRIKSDAGGQQITTNTGTLGTDATVTYEPVYPNAPNDLRYYCTSHGNGMGNTITMNNPNTIQQTTSSTTTSQSNPYGTPDPTAEYPQEIYKIDRKSTENRAAVQFELAASFDLANIRIPLRVCTKELFPSIGTFMP
jgi:lambda family phage minor tail protein L